MVLSIKQPLLLLTPTEGRQTLVLLLRTALVRCPWIATDAEPMSGTSSLRSVAVAPHRMNARDLTLNAQDLVLSAPHRVLLTTVIALVRRTY